MSLLPSFARQLARPTAHTFHLRALATGSPRSPADSLLQAALGSDASSSSSSSSSSRSSTTSASAAADSAMVDANLYGPTDFYASDASASSTSYSSAQQHQRADGLTPADPAYFAQSTIPYDPNMIPQTADPLCDFWVGLTMKHGEKLKATILLSKVLDTIARHTQSPPLPIFRSAIIAASPLCRLKSIRKGAKTMVVPIPLNERQRTRFGIQWILKAADKRSAIDFEKRVAMEMLAVLDGTSNVLKMIDERHKVAMMNRSNLPKDIAP